jgi:hypothetical protein
MEDKYGAEGETDNEGFDPYADSVAGWCRLTQVDPRLSPG